ncbi:hypothetical protein GGF50DRAFT_113031 [Schizophyllum commune]
MVALRSGKRLDVSVLERAANLANITLHRGGLTPSPDQKAEILTAIEELETLLYKADQEISRTEAMAQNEVEGANRENPDNKPSRPATDLPRLEALKADISAQLAISRALIAPIRLLPPELLSEIFACLLAYPDTWHLKWMDTHCPSFVCVCAHWRRVALATPSLWTTIHIEPRWRVPHVPERLEALLERSAGMPLDIELGVDWEGCAETFKFAARVSGDRWRSLSLQDSPEDAFSLPRLHRLVVECGTRYLDLRALAGAPNLRELVVSTQHLFFKVPVWPALTDLTLDLALVHGTEHRNALYVIKQHRLTLERLLAFDEHSDDSDHGPLVKTLAEMCEVPNLRSAEVRGGTWAFLEAMITPKLESLTLHRCCVLESDEDNPFKSLAEGTLLKSHSLLRLRICDVTMKPDGLKHLYAALDALPTLQSLEVEEYENSYILHREFLRFLTLIPGEAPHLPNITSLSLMFCRGGWKRHDAVYHDLVRELARSRAMERTLEVFA